MAHSSYMQIISNLLFSGSGVDKSKSRCHLYRLLCGIFSLMFLLTACTTLRLPEYRAQPVEHYHNSQTKDGLVMAIHPITKKAETKKWFGIDLLKKGVLPILVVLANRNASSSFAMSKDQVFIMDEETSGRITSKRNQVASSSGGEAALLVGTVLISLPLVIAGLKTASNADVVNRNLAEKELHKTTISPGEQVHGFAYFQIPKEKEITGRYHVIVKVSEVFTDEVTTFDFVISLNLER